jgi:alginate O-acetyltransferase complex protein AlgI
MVYSDPLFLFLYLPLLLAAYLASPLAVRNPLLLVASLGFYAVGEQQYTVVMLGSICLNYLFGRALDSDRFANRLRMLWLGLALNLLGLLFFKYTNFLAGELNHLLKMLGQPGFNPPHIHLPLGISFFVFQGMSYLIDVYRREVPAERSLFRFALFKSLFPQLIAGPIVRYPDVAKQLHSRHLVLSEFTRGAERFIIGLGKKVLLANPTGAVADQVFALPNTELSTPIAWLGLVCYALQIYFDFSGYSDMAIGLGRCFGFTFRENFDYPYSAVTVTEFWRRWHLSLSTWFRDYLYIPLGGNRLGKTRTYVNLFIVFALCGLWHGASWNFLIWGLWHGSLLALERGALANPLARASRTMSAAYTLVAVGAGWVFFRAESLSQAVTWLATLGGLGDATGGQPFGYFWNTELALVLIAAGVGCTPWPKRAFRTLIDAGPPWLVQSSVLVGVATLLVVCGSRVAAGAYSPFIYFRF